MIGCRVVKKSASGVRMSARRLRLVIVTMSATTHAQAVALTRLHGRGTGAVDGGGRHAASFPSVTSLLRARPKPRFGFAAVVLGVLVDLGLVAGQAQEDVVEAGLAQGQAGDRRSAPRRASAAPRRPTPGPFVDGQLDRRGRRRPAPSPRAASSSWTAAVHGIAVAQGHRDHRGPEVGLELGRRALGDDAPVVDHDDVAGQAVGLLEVLGGEQHRRALARPAPR